MVIQHNMHAMFSERQLGITTRDKAKSQEKLSSGYKINRAADNAAGLAISEKMRKQISGLHRGEGNINEGIDLVKIADGAMAEVCDELQRMRELSIQAYNETNSDSDRKAIQAEIEQLKTEIDRTGESTKYNELYIFRDSWKKGHIHQVNTVTKTETNVRVEERLSYDSKEAPDWLTENSDMELVVHAAYDYPPGVNEEGKNQDGYMLQQFYETAYVYVYKTEKEDVVDPITGDVVQRVKRDENNQPVFAKTEDGRLIPETDEDNNPMIIGRFDHTQRDKTLYAYIDDDGNTKKVEWSHFSEACNIPLYYGTYKRNGGNIVVEDETPSYGTITKDGKTYLNVQKEDGVAKLRNVRPYYLSGGGDVVRTINSEFGYYAPSDYDTTYLDGSGYVKYGTWNNSIKDNPSARINLGAIAEADSAEKLLKMITEDLLGTALGAPCGSCNDGNKFYGISYVGRLGDYEAQPTSFAYKWYDKEQGSLVYVEKPKTELDLNDVKIEVGDEGEEVSIYDAISELFIRHQDSESTLSEDEKKNESLELARKVAKAIRDDSVKRMQTNPAQNTHFDRVIADPNSDYAFIIYDYRDRDKIKSTDTDSQILNKTQTSKHYFETIEETIEETKTEVIDKDVETRKQIKIQCSGTGSDYMAIELPTLDLDYLGLRDYRVDGWRTWYETKLADDYKAREARNAEKTKKYEKELQSYYEELNKYYRELADWEQKANGTWVKDGVQEWDEPVEMQKSHFEHYVEDGELKSRYIDDGIETSMVHCVREIGHYEYPDNIPEKPKKPKEPQKPALEDLYVTVGRKVVGPSLTDEIDDALAKLMKQRSYLGAVQNRLEHAYNVNANTEENTTAAESRIRDTDIPEEMVRYARSNILEQAGQSMLAQANQSTNGIMSLLQ